MSVHASIVWFFRDLRLTDNPALTAALQAGGPVIPVFIWSAEEEGEWKTGAASRWWLHQSLTSLDASLREHGSRLIIREGPSLIELKTLITEVGASTVFWNRRYEPEISKRDSRIQTMLQAAGVRVETFNGSLLFEPSEIRNKQGQPFQVFTPFWRTCLSHAQPIDPLPTPEHLPPPDRWPDTVELARLSLEPEFDWAGGIRKAWHPGSRGAIAELDHFVRESMVSYSDARDRPDRQGTSRLSPHLHFGEVSPHQVWRAARELQARDERHEVRRSAEAYLRQLGWREFAHNILTHFPHTSSAPLRHELDGFPWREDAGVLKAWQHGRTGYPVVDAGMRELWSTGWMHNRVRMIVASFLVKDLLIPWQEGARWFWDTLVDADLANNSLGWQWVAGCGADAAPYFRIFNPVSQGQKFDPQGDYVRQWVPELRGLPTRFIHQPWIAPTAVLDAAAVEPGKIYATRLVDHAEARQRALVALAIAKDLHRKKQLTSQPE